jgi:hypothetical protein
MSAGPSTAKTLTLTQTLHRPAAPAAVPAPADDAAQFQGERHSNYTVTLQTMPCSSKRRAGGGEGEGGW